MLSRFTGSALLALALALPGHAADVSQKAGLAWLDAKTTAPDLNVSGTWESTTSYWAGGWGKGVWVQKGPEVIGNLGLYTIQGRVAGKQLFVLVCSGNKVYYTAILEPGKDGSLSGIAVTRMLADDPDARTAERLPVALVAVK